MISFDLANRYLSAWITKHEPKDKIRLLKELQAHHALIQNAAILLQALQNPKLDTHQKKRILGNILEKNSADTKIKHFYNTLIDKKREAIFLVLAKTIDTLLRDLSPKKKASIYVSKIPNDTTKEKIVSIIEDQIKKPIDPRFETDTQLLGGFKAVVHHQLINCSCKHILDIYKETVLVKT